MTRHELFELFEQLSQFTLRHLGQVFVIKRPTPTIVGVPRFFKALNELGRKISKFGILQFALKSFKRNLLFAYLFLRLSFVFNEFDEPSVWQGEATDNFLSQFRRTIINSMIRRGFRFGTDRSWGLGTTASRS